MKRMSIVGLCLFAVLAMSAVMVSTAVAAPPDFGRCLKKAKKEGAGFSDAGCTKAVGTGASFEWTNTIVKNKFSASASTLSTLETVGGTKITCTSEKNTGAEYTGEKTVGKIVAEFAGCETSKIACNSTGEGSGKITTFALKGLIGREVALPSTKLEAQLTPEVGEKLAEFKCSTISVEVKGCVAHPITSDKMLSSSAEKFTASKGEQKPDKFAGGPVDECALSSNSGTGFEEAGQTITATILNEEKIEANALT